MSKKTENLFEQFRKRAKDYEQRLEKKYDPLFAKAWKEAKRQKGIDEKNKGIFALGWVSGRLSKEKEDN